MPMFLRSSRGGEGWLPGGSIEDDEDEGRGVGGARGGGGGSLSSVSRGMSASKQQDVLAQFKVGVGEGRTVGAVCPPSAAAACEHTCLHPSSRAC